MEQGNWLTTGEGGRSFMNSLSLCQELLWTVLWAGAGHHDTSGTTFSTLPRVWWESQTLQPGDMTWGVAQGVRVY